MRMTALLVTAAAALALTACNKAEEKADGNATEAVEAAGVADPAASTSMDQAAADAQAAAEAAEAAELAPAEAAAPAVTEPAPAAAAPAAAH
jgi:hypothetical protein